MNNELPVTELDYVSGRTVIPADAFGISPSQLYQFFEKPHLWYRSEVLDQRTFFGNTSTYLGTIVHYCAKCYSRTQRVDELPIYSYLAKSCTPTSYDLVMAAYADDKTAIEELLISRNESSLDVERILQQFRPMANVLMKFLKQIGLPQRTEEMIFAEVKPGYFACGSCDAVYANSRVIDYKTTSALTAPTSIPESYRLQLLVYAWIYKQMGLPINAISIIWVTSHEVGRYGVKGKALQDYPATATQCTETVTDADFDFIEKKLRLVADTVELSNASPKHLHILWRDETLQ